MKDETLNQILNNSFKPNKEYDNMRLEANIAILKHLEQYLLDNPSLRFGQALIALNLAEIDFNEEPMVTLKKLKE